MISGGERGAGFCINSPRTSCVERGLQVLEELEEHAKPMKRCEEKREEWAEHWQCDFEVQGLEDMPWRSEGLKVWKKGCQAKGREPRKNIEELQGYEGFGR